MNRDTLLLALRAINQDPAALAQCPLGEALRQLDASAQAPDDFLRKHSHLLHYLQKRSYQKALTYVQELEA